MVFCITCGFKDESLLSNCSQCGEILINQDELDEVREKRKKENTIQKSQESKSSTTSTQSSVIFRTEERKPIGNETQTVKQSTQNVNTLRTRAVTVPQNNGTTKSVDTIGSKPQTTDSKPNTTPSTTPPLNKITSFSSISAPRQASKQCPGWKAGVLFDRCANCSQPKIRHEESKPSPPASVTSKPPIIPSTDNNNNNNNNTPPPRPNPPVAAKTSFPVAKQTAPPPANIFKPPPPPAKPSQPPAPAPKAAAPPPVNIFKPPPPPAKPSQPPAKPGPPPAASKASTQPAPPPSNQNPEPPEFKIKTRRSTMMSHNMLDSSYIKPLPPTPCAKCKIPLPPNEEIVQFQSKLFHQQCFTCATCNCTFSKTNVYYEKKGVPYCEKDFFANGGVCQTCKNQITGETQFIEVNGVPFHEACFHCTGCRKMFDVKKKFCLWVDQKPFCDGCGRKAFLDIYTQKRKPVEVQYTF